MQYSNDMRYVDHGMIERGLAYAAPYSIRIDRYFTEDEMTENKAVAEALRNAGRMDEWGARCDAMAAKIGDEVVALLSEIEKRFSIAQYHTPYHYHGEKVEDFWFWCNSKDGERDYSYVTLSFWKERDAEERRKVIIEIERILDSYQAHNIQAYIQYETLLDKPACKREAERIYVESKGKFVAYGINQGRLYKDEENGEYYFKRKKARKYYSHLSAAEVCSCVLV